MDLEYLYNGSPSYNFIQQYNCEDKKVILLILMPRLSQHFDLKLLLNQKGHVRFIYNTQSRTRDDGLIDQVSTLMGDPQDLSTIQFLEIPQVYKICVEVVNDYVEVSQLLERMNWAFDRLDVLLHNNVFELMSDQRIRTRLDLTKRIVKMENKYKSNRQQLVSNPGSVVACNSPRIYANEQVAAIHQAIENLKLYIQRLKEVERRSVKLN